MTLIFDIESIGVDPEQLAEHERERIAAKDEGHGLEFLALSPFTGHVVVISAYDDEKHVGVCLTVDCPVVSSVVKLPQGFVHKNHDTEAQLLAAFWDVCSRQRRFATFNGEDFEKPFLLGRSLALHIGVHRPLYMAKPWEDIHVDLCSRLKMGFRGKPNLDSVCRALGVPTPKGGGINGAEVGRAWNDGRRADVAAYCCRDTKATADVLAAYDASMGVRAAW